MGPLYGVSQSDVQSDRPTLRAVLADQRTASVHGQSRGCRHGAVETGAGTGIRFRADHMEIMLTIGAAVAESRQAYEQYRFLVTEDNPAKDEMLKDFGGRVADAMGTAGNTLIISAATLCASAVIPAITAILAGNTPPVAAVGAA